MARANSTTSSITRIAKGAEPAPGNPLITDFPMDTVANVNNVLAYLMGSIGQAEMSEFGIDPKTRALPQNGVSMILECCVEALAHCQKQEGGGQ